MKTFLKIDYWMQTMLFISMCLTIPFIFIPMVLLAVIGAWQLLSGAITGLFLTALNRNFYLPKAIGYLGLLFAGDLWSKSGQLPSFLDSGFGFVGFFLLFPVLIGLWYYNMVSKDYKFHCKKEIIASNTMKANSPMEKML